MKEEILQQLQKIVKDLTPEDIKIDLSIPNDNTHGDYATNVAMQVFARMKDKGLMMKYTSPLELAKEIASRFTVVISSVGEKSSEDLSTRPSDLVEMKSIVQKVEAVAPGFINFYLSQDALTKNLQQVLESPENVGRTGKIGKGRKAVVEYSSPNIAKPFTIGHLRSTIIGDAVANLLSAVGYEVYRDNHLGDWGTQFGKQIYAIKTWGNEEEIENSENPVKNLVALYVKFHEESEKNPVLEEEGRKWFKKLEDGDEEARRLWKKCIDWSFKEFDKIYKELGVKFTENDGRGYGEAFFEDKMNPVIDELKEKGLLKEDKGAQLVYFTHDKYPPLMVVKSDGATLYATRDLTTDRFRLSHYGPEVLVINEVGAEQSLYWRQIFETEYILGWYKPGQRVHVGHGLYRFKEGKMSTRKGNVIWLEDVLEEAGKRAFSLVKQDAKIEGTEIISTSKKEGKAAQKNLLGYAEKINVSKQVAIGALKWNDLKRSAHLDVTFDWDEILSMQGNSGPYVQYTYARTQSLLAKSVEQRAKGSALSTKPYALSIEELLLLRKLVHFPDIVETAATTYSPNVVVEYLFELAQLFNNFYQKYRILNADTNSTPEVGEVQQDGHTSGVNPTREFRLALTAGVGVVLKQGLYLLGIQAPEKM